MSANEHGYTIGEPDSRSWLDLYRELEATKQGLAAVQAERDEALKILDTHSRADLLDACRQVKQTAISEADNAKQAESRLAAVRALVVEARRRAPTHGDQEWDWLLGELNTTLLREAEGTPPPQANTPNVLTGYCVNGEHGRCHNNFCGCECHVSGTPPPQADVLDTIELVANSLLDVAALKGFAPSVNPVRWATDNAQYLRAAVRKLRWGRPDA